MWLFVIILIISISNGNKDLIEGKQDSYRENAKNLNRDKQYNALISRAKIIRRGDS